MKLILKTLSKSLIVMGILSLPSFATAAEFDYSTKASSTNYVDGRTSGSSLFGNEYYVGGTIGQSEASSYCNGANSCEDSDTAWKIFGGYKLLEIVSVEGSYINLGDIRRDGENSDVSAFAGFAVGTLPITQKFDAFAKLGGAYWTSENTDGKESGFGLAYGLGAKMTLNKTTKLRAEWEKIENIETSDTNESDVNMLSVGVEITTF